MTDDIYKRFARGYQQYHRISEDRARRQLKLLRAFEATLDGRSILEATSEDFQAFAGQLLAHPYNVNTVRTKLNMIRPFFSWAYAVKAISAEQYMELKSVGNPRGATGKSTPRPYAPQELDQFWADLDAQLPYLPERGKGSQAIKRWMHGTGRWQRVYKHAMRLQVEAIVALALDCGLRRGEIFNLSMDQLHYDNEYIVVHGAPKGNGIERIRKVPFTDEAREKVKLWLEFRATIRPTHSRPWLSLYGQTAYMRPMRFKRFEQLLGKVVGPYELHRFRHTCATNWLRAGMTLEKVSKLIGHTSLEQTLAYAEILEGDVARDVARHEGDFAKLNRRPERKAA